MSEEQDEKTVEYYLQESESSPDEESQEEVDTVETPEPSEEVQEDTEEDETSELPEGLKKRFSKLTAEKHRLNSAYEEAERKRAEAEAKLQSYQQKGPERPVKPTLEQFDYDEEKLEDARDKYFEDLADWKAQQRLGEFEQKGAADRVLSHKEELRQNYLKNVEKSGIEDYDEKFDTLIVALEKAQVIVPDHLIEAIQTDENGPKIVEYFSSNPDKAITVSKLGTVQAALEIGRLSAKVSNGKPLPTTKAPKPVKPVKGSGVKPKDTESMSVSDWADGDLSHLGFSDR